MRTKNGGRKTPHDYLVDLYNNLSRWGDLLSNRAPFCAKFRADASTKLHTSSFLRILLQFCIVLPPKWVLPPLTLRLLPTPPPRPTLPRRAHIPSTLHPLTARPHPTFLSPSQSMLPPPYQLGYFILCHNIPFPPPGWAITSFIISAINLYIYHSHSLYVYLRISVERATPMWEGEGTSKDQGAASTMLPSPRTSPTAPALPAGPPPHPVPSLLSAGIFHLYRLPLRSVGLLQLLLAGIFHLYRLPLTPMGIVMLC